MRAPDAKGAMAGMKLEDWLAMMDSGAEITDGEARDMLCELTQEARKVTMWLNSGYRKPDRIRSVLSELFGRPIDETTVISTPFYTDCGKNIRLGRNIFINTGCTFQDQGGITIDDGALIGHNAMICTLTHNHDPGKRNNMFPAPVHIGKNVWLGANVTVLPGVTIGDNAVVAAGAVVDRDVDADTVVAGVPAKTLRKVQWPE